MIGKEEKMRYNNLRSYFREKYGKRLKKICIDGGFTCPNRDGKCGTGGCIFCGERGAGEHIDPKASIREQVLSVLDGAKDDELFIAYFQNFTNTYAPVEVLRERYGAALIDKRIKILDIGTRPDCITEEICELIASYKSTHDVIVELGLQTASDETAKIINRGYTSECFEQAMRLLKKHEIDICVHLIIGLPGEGDAQVAKSCEYLSRFDIAGYKIHSIYVMRGTRLAEMYERGEYSPPTEDEYVRRAAYIISHISPDAIVHRLTGDCPDGLMLAPDWNSDKHALIAKINTYLEENNLTQGCYFDVFCK